MDLEELENEYNLNVEKEDETFLKKVNDLANKNKKKELEVEYRARLKELLQEHNKKVSSFLSRKDVKLFEREKSFEEENLDKEKKPSSFKVEQFNFKLSAFDKERIKWKIFRFNFRILWRNFLHKILPSKLILFLLTVKLDLMNAYFELRYFFENLFRRIFLFFRTNMIRLKAFFVRVFIFIKGLFLRASSFFGKGKVKESETKKGELQKGNSIEEGNKICAKEELVKN